MSSSSPNGFLLLQWQQRRRWCRQASVGVAWLRARKATRRRSTCVFAALAVASPEVTAAAAAQAEYVMMQLFAVGDAVATRAGKEHGVVRKAGLCANASADGLRTSYVYDVEFNSSGGATASKYMITTMCYAQHLLEPYVAGAKRQGKPTFKVMGKVSK